MQPGIIGAAANLAVEPGDTGWLSPGTVANHLGSGWQNWVNIDNVKNTSTSVATCFLQGSMHFFDESHYIRATNFDFSAIPSGATLYRLYVRARWKASYSTPYSSSHWIAFEGAVNGTSSTDVKPTATMLTYERNQSSDLSALWNISGITTDDVINDSTFGCLVGGLAQEIPYEEFTLSMEYVQMKIEWIG